jgi:hypothetical protein
MHYTVGMVWTVLCFSLVWLSPTLALATDRSEAFAKSLKAGSQMEASAERSRPSIMLFPQDSTSLFRDPPTLTSRFGLGTSFLPFIGMGFQGGETSDVTRQVLRESTFDTRTPLSNRLSQGLIPNEFQAGLRIRF